VRFHFDEDHELFQTAVRDFLAKECTPETIRGLWETPTARSAALWKKLAEVGFAGFLVPEAHDGAGQDEIGLVLLQEEAGRAALAEPVIETSAVAVPLLVELADEALAGRWLPRVAAGEARLAVGHPVSPFVADADVADLLLLPHGDALHAVPADAAQATHEPANDPSRRLFSVRFEPSPATRVAEGERVRALLDAALDRGALSAAAQLLGVADRLVALAVAYTSERTQFGRPVGSFQAVKHMLADVKVRLEYARPVVQRAAWSVARSAPLRSLHVSMAKHQAAEAAELAARRALQAHGAIGYTWEQDLHIWMRRAWSLARAWGDPAFHRARIAEALLEGGLAIGPGTTFRGDA
jgi:alkylation response protein AidB-like acyl-CoA dehydrogenase